MKTKIFDCVDAKRRAQEDIRQRVQGLSSEEEIAFFQRGSAEFLEALRQAKDDPATDGETKSNPGSA